jgi:hypothetical protein
MEGRCIRENLKLKCLANNLLLIRGACSGYSLCTRVKGSLFWVFITQRVSAIFNSQ